MRRILRLTDTGRFIKAPGEDTTYFHEGQPFSGFADAWTFCNERGLEGTELVLIDENGEEQLCIRIN